jgi:arylsulfatase A-like enzyme
MRRLRDAGKLSPAQADVFARPRPAEELYDTQNDPHELNNLASDPKYQRELNRLRAALDRWAADTGDVFPAVRSEDEFDRETGAPLPNRMRPRLPKHWDRSY